MGLWGGAISGNGTARIRDVKGVKAGGVVRCSWGISGWVSVGRVKDVR